MAGPEGSPESFRPSVLGPAERAFIEREAARHALSRSTFGVAVYAILPFILALATPYGSDHPLIVYGLAAGMLVLSAIRGGMALAILRRSDSSLRGFGVFGAATLAQATTWAAFVSVTLLLYGFAWMTMLVLLVAMGLSSGATTMLAPHRRLLYAYMLCTLAPVALTSFFAGGEHGVVLGVVMLLHLGYRFVEAKRRSTEMWESLESTALLQLRASELDRARARAETANRAKTVFFANISHEIRTPLNGVLGMTRLLRRTRLDSEQRRFVDTIATSGDALLGLVNDVLDFSKIEAGHLALERVDFDLGAALEDVAETLAAAAQAKGVELVAAIHPLMPSLVQGDPTRVRQIAMNLVGNAIKFIEQGEVVLSGRVLEHARGSVRVRIEVADSGVGIPEGVRERLFQPFAQADESTTRRYGGTGLGLAIAKKLAESMGGEIGFDSKLDKGSTFWVEIPFVSSPADRGGLKTGLSELMGRRAICCDRSPTVRRALDERLAAWGIGCEGASDAKELRALLDRASARGVRYEVVLLASDIAGANAEELAERAALGQEPIRNVIELARVTDLAHEQKAATAAKRVTKPVRASRLLMALLSAGRATRARTVPVPANAAPEATASQHKWHLLVVEDNPINQLVTMRMLAFLGYEADLAQNGREALAAVRARDYDAILMDCQMPLMDGFEATRAIREIERDRARHTPILAVTAHAVRGDRDRCIAAGMNDYLPKPFSEEQLGDLIERWVGASTEAPTVVALADAAEPRAPSLAQTLERASTPPFDENVLAELRSLQDEADPTFFTDLVRSFLTEAPALRAAIQTAVESGDGKELHDAAHRLKSSTRLLGAEPTSELCIRLEQLGTSELVEESRDVLPKLDRELERLRSALETHVVV